MKFRPIEDKDVDATIALWERCGLTRPWNDPYKDIAFARGKPNSDVLVAERDGKIIASAMVGHDGHRGGLYYVSVDPDHQNQGLGRATCKRLKPGLKSAVSGRSTFSSAAGTPMFRVFTKPSDMKQATCSP